MANTTLFLLCDLQSIFRTAIHEYHHVVATTNKMLKFAKLFECPVIVTTQNAKALGPTDPQVELASLGILHRQTIDKTLFSMFIPEIQALVSELGTKTVVLMGIESHICILQTALELLIQSSICKISEVYVVADAVSSCNAFEVPIALDAMRHAGVKVLTSESIGFLLMRDASLPSFKEFARIVKESKGSTKAAGEALLQRTSL
ncbi:MAG: Isochorismatase-like protein [Lentinula lateritia]|uniref:Isochorismatase-like protein n=1 Tax=Lentinula lateritia TaxID=40482 RepID=A0ABQ8VW78_9AGAR|nr:MAG: Isochorismatase-like protein [Lentinula lateritia]KAJ4499857.1 Isochorismatase-like protein [Lentinula lateritia]